VRQYPCYEFSPLLNAPQSLLSCNSVKSPSSGGVAAYNHIDTIGIVCSEYISGPRPPSVHGSVNGRCLYPTTHLGGSVHRGCLRRLADKPICWQRCQWSMYLLGIHSTTFAVPVSSCQCHCSCLLT
jgi:hypothetical protein